MRLGCLLDAERTYKEMFERTIVEQEALSKKLREEKKNIKETHEESVGQRQQVRSLLIRWHALSGSFRAC